MSHRYECLRPLEPGPNVSVYLLEDRWENLQRKVLTLLPCHTSQRTERLQLEKLYLSRRALDHPSLVRVEDLAYRGRRVGLVSEFIERLPFQKWKLSPGQTQATALELVQLIGYLHRRNFFCGCLSPSKLFLASNNRLVVNIVWPHCRAKVNFRDTQHIRYASPEYLNSELPSLRADLYSLGLILYHLLTGYPPYAEEEINFLKQKQLLTFPAKPRKLNPDVASEVEQLILDLIQKKPELRPPSAEYVEEVLRGRSESKRVAVPRFRSVLIGRDAEIVVFRKIFEEYSKLNGAHFVVVGGPSGIGKTSLVEHFEIIAKIHGAKTYAASHHWGGGVFEVFRKFLEKATGTTKEGDATEGLNGSAFQSPSLLAEVLLNTLKKDLDDRPTVLCVNDFQWMDEGSLEVYKLIARSADFSLLVIGNYRTDELAGHWEELKSELVRTQALTEFSLGPLKNGHVKQLASNLLGDMPSEDVLARIVTECGGNPFYIYEFLRFMQEMGKLSFMSGHWEWSSPILDGNTVPGTVTENIEGRLKRIKDEQIRILEYLAVVEKPTPLDLLSKMIEMPLDILNGIVTDLDRLDFVTVHGSLDRPLVGLSHDWVGRVLRHQLKGREREIHGAIASVLEKESVIKKDPFLLEATVQHFLRAGAGSKLKIYIWNAITSLENRRLYKDAAQLTEEALEAGVLTIKDWNSARKAVELFNLSGQFEKCINFGRKYLNQNHKLEPSKKASLLSLLARVYITTGQIGKAVKLLSEAQNLPLELEDPELTAELKGQWLVCLSRIGDHARSEQMANNILRDLRDGNSSPWLEKLYSSIAHFHHERGSLDQFLHWETKSLQLVFDQGKYIRCAGRICNVAEVHLTMGRLAAGERFARYSLGLADDVGNPELAVFSKSYFCVHDRKQGRHRNAVRSLRELLQVNRDLNQNRHIETELSLELAKNFTHQLLPEHALSAMSGYREVSAGQEISCSRVDAILAEGWIWISVGQIKRASMLIRKLQPQSIPREHGRYLLLRSKTQFALGELKLAWEDACAAWDSFPGYMIYHRTRTRFLQGEILLEQSEFDTAGPLIKEGLETAKREFYLPFMTKGYALRARWLSATGKNQLARTYCLRALQVANHVERPGLRAEIYYILGKIEAALGNRERAIQAYTEALQILKERLLHLSPTYRESFAKQYIEPIEADRNLLLHDVPDAAPRYLIQLGHFAAKLKDTRDPKQLAEKVVEVMKEALPSFSLNVFLRQRPEETFQLLASRGRCQQTGRHLLPASSNNHLVLVNELSKTASFSPPSLGIALRLKDQVVGLIYLEKKGKDISEAEIDFLVCLGSMLEMQLAAQSLRPLRAKKATQVQALTLKNGLSMLGEHPTMQKLFEEIRRVARTEATVLISGESGTGKELVARSIHEYSRRQKGDFVPINCSALPEQLIENELFGHARGSFTGAQQDKRGLFEVASGGTLFLDEIATMPIGLQSRLLRVLQDKKIRRVGDTMERIVDVRIVAATNQSLHDLVERHEFREDLYHRLNVYHLQIPPLRERASDIPRLALHFLKCLNHREGKATQIAPEALELLARYSFPGNVRELENIIESAYHLCTASEISAEEIAPRLYTTTLHAGTQPREQLIVDDLISGRTGFWQAVRDPFLRRDLSRDEVRRIISLGLSNCGGNYRRLLEHFRLPTADYKKFISFLTNHDCKVDFHPFRKAANGVS